MCSKWSCDPTTESSFSIAERAQRAQTSLKSEWSYGDVKKQAVEKSSNHTDWSNCLKTGQLCSINGGSQNDLQTENVQRHMNVRTVTVCVSLPVNGAPSSSSASHSNRGLSDDADVTGDDVQANRANSPENSTATTELGENGDSSGMSQGHVSSPLFNTGCVRCTFSGLAGDGSYAKNSAHLSGGKGKPCNGAFDGSDRFAESEDLVLQNERKDDRILDTVESVPAAQMTGVLGKETEAVVDELVSEVAECKEADSGGGSVHSGRGEMSAVKMRQDVVDSAGRGMLASADSGLLKTGPKLDDLCQEDCREGSDAGARDVVSAYTAPCEVRGRSPDSSVSCDARSGDHKLATSAEDAQCRSDQVTPADGSDVTPNRQSVEKQLPEMASGIANLQSWIDSANSNPEMNAAADGGAIIHLDAVEQYVGEMLKQKSELDRLNALVKELQISDGETVACDERHRLVPIHAQLHNLSATFNRLASQTVCTL